MSFHRDCGGLGTILLKWVPDPQKYWVCVFEVVSMYVKLCMFGLYCVRLACVCFVRVS